MRLFTKDVHTDASRQTAKRWAFIFASVQQLNVRVFSSSDDCATTAMVRYVLQTFGPLLWLFSHANFNSFWLRAAIALFCASYLHVFFSSKNIDHKLGEKRVHRQR